MFVKLCGGIVGRAGHDGAAGRASSGMPGDSGDHQLDVLCEFERGASAQAGDDERNRATGRRRSIPGGG